MRLRVHFQKLLALFRLGFPAAPVQTDLNLATENDSPAHFTKGIPSPSTLSRTLPAPIDCRHTGSGLFHSPPGVLFTFPSRYCFAIGRHQYLALDHGRPGFNRNSTCSGLLGRFLREPSTFRLRGFHPLWHAFPIHFDYIDGLSLPDTPAGVSQKFPQPRKSNGRSLDTPSVWASPLSLTTTQGISSISSPRATEMFHFTRFPPLTRVTGLLQSGCPIRTPPDLGMLASPRRFSQLAASFIG